MTGGKQPGDRFTEAGASADYLHEHGVPESAILRETTGRTSWQSLAAAARFLKERDLTHVVLVSDPYHSARIEDIAHEVGLDAVTSPTRTSPIKGVGEWRRFFTETMRVAAGRIFGYGRLDRHRAGREARSRPRYTVRSAAAASSAVVAAPIRGWCNRQHDRFWPCYWGFESSPPSPSQSHRLPRSSSGLGRQVLILVTRVQIPYGVPNVRSEHERSGRSFRDCFGRLFHAVRDFADACRLRCATRDRRRTANTTCSARSPYRAPTPHTYHSRMRTCIAACTSIVHGKPTQ